MIEYLRKDRPLPSQGHAPRQPPLLILEVAEHVKRA